MEQEEQARTREAGAVRDGGSWWWGMQRGAGVGAVRLAGAAVPPYRRRPLAVLPNHPASQGRQSPRTRLSGPQRRPLGSGPRPSKAGDAASAVPPCPARSAAIFSVTHERTVRKGTVHDTAVRREQARGMWEGRERWRRGDQGWTGRQQHGRGDGATHGAGRARRTAGPPLRGLRRAAVCAAAAVSGRPASRKALSGVGGRGGALSAVFAR